MQSLLNYKEGAKRDPVQHNSVFLHDSPITAKEEGAPACCSKERRKECVTVNGPSSECGKLGRSSCFYLRTIDWWLFFPRQDTHLKRLKACCVNSKVWLSRNKSSSNDQLWGCVPNVQVCVNICTSKWKQMKLKEFIKAEFSDRKTSSLKVQPDTVSRTADVQSPATITATWRSLQLACS